MAQRKYYQLFILLALFQSIFPERRIKDGKEVISDKKYVVYLLKAASAPNQYSGWLCGGAIINKDYVITSAACVQDVQHIYVVPGLARLRSTSSEFGRSRSVTPSSERRGPRPSAARRALLMGLAAEAAPRDPEMPPPEVLPRSLGIAVQVTPGGSFKITGDTVPIQQTPGGTVRRVMELEPMPSLRYKKYVSADKIDDDKCVREKKKKVVLTCVPRSYQFEYNRTEVWAKIDIAVVKVESPFDFNDKSYEIDCSYTPQPIEFNTEKEFPKPGDDVIVLGWGHSKEFRKDHDLIDMNQATLHYAPTRVLEEEICVTYFQGNRELASFIASSMLCTLEPGNLDDKGELILRSPPIAQGCVTETARLRGAVGRMCDDEARAEAMVYEGGVDGPDILYEDGAGEFVVNNTKKQHAKNIKSKNVSDVKKQHQSNEKFKDYEVELLKKDGGDGEKIVVDLPEYPGSQDRIGEDTPGICQNDHGGPLVAWRGGQEVLVAVATLYKLDNKLQCMGPYLFTKTWCNGAFLQCIVDQENHDATRRRCEDPEEVGFEIVRRHISWVGHRDGPADNEQIQIRHQVPMSVYQPKYPRPRPT